MSISDSEQYDLLDKVLPRRASSDRVTVERFRREARAGARLHHTNIVPVFEVGEDRDVRFYAMQFIQGQGLDSVITELRLLRDRTGSAPRISAAFKERSPRPQGGELRQTILGTLRYIDLWNIAALKDGLTDVGMAWDRPASAPVPKDGPARDRASPTADVVVIRPGKGA